MRFIRDHHGQLIAVSQIRSVKERKSAEGWRYLEVWLLDGSRLEVGGTLDSFERDASTIIPAATGWRFAVKINDGDGAKSYVRTQPIVGWVMVGGSPEPVLLTDDATLSNSTAVVSPSGDVVSGEFDREFATLEEWLNYKPDSA